MCVADKEESEEKCAHQPKTSHDREERWKEEIEKKAISYFALSL